MNMTETILVTGRTGNIGSEIVKQLLNCKSDINLKDVRIKKKYVRQGISEHDQEPD